MGLIHKSYYSYLPNATKCNTIGDVFRSHKTEKVIVQVNDIYGILVLLGLGLGMALLIFPAEIILLVREKAVFLSQGRAKLHMLHKATPEEKHLTWHFLN